MRAINFRAWDTKTGLMFQDVVLARENVFFSKLDPMSKTNEELIPMQFTGLKDKNGKEIYEGDILREHKDKRCKPMIAVVEWDEYTTGFSFEGHWDYGDLDTNWNETEVIGNIYENPELLGGKK